MGKYENNCYTKTRRFLSPPLSIPQAAVGHKILCRYIDVRMARGGFTGGVPRDRQKQR